MHACEYTYLNLLIIFYFKVSKYAPDPVYCPNNCGRCYKGVGRKASLNKHLNHECGVPKKYECPYCIKRFAYNYNRNKHCLIIHKVNLKL